MDYRTTLTGERLNPHRMFLCPCVKTALHDETSTAQQKAVVANFLLTRNHFRTNDKSHFCGIAVDCIEENKQYENVTLF